LGPDSPAEAFWAAIPAPLVTKVYLFNVSNPDDVKLGAKPDIREVGPYVFDEYHFKTKVKWNAKNDTVTYQQIRRYFVNALQSQRDLDTPVTILNGVGATLGSLVAPMSAAERVMVNLGIGILKESLFTSQTPRDIVFDGYKDPLLDMASVLASLGVHFPGQMDKFAIFYQRNNSDWYDGVWNMFTGKNDLSLANKMHTWNFTNQTSFFPGKCSQVRGNAELFTPLEGPQEFVELYSNDLCRPMRLHNVGEEKVRGVAGVRYEMLSSYFGNRTQNPDNWCYDGGREWPSGVYNASACRFGAPAFLSLPHFYNGDPYYVDQFTKGSLAPNASRHSTYFVLEPTSGIPIEVVARFQVNFFMEPIKELSMFKGLKGPLFFPAFWFETKMVLTDQMKMGVWILANLHSLLLAIGVGQALLVLAVLAVLRIHRSAKAKATKATEPKLRSTSASYGATAGDVTDDVTGNVEEEEEEVSDNSVGPLIPPPSAAAATDEDSDAAVANGAIRREYQYTSTPKT